MTTIEKLKDLRSKFENSYMAVNLMDSLIGYDVANEEIIAAIDDIIATID